MPPRPRRFGSKKRRCPCGDRLPGSRAVVQWIPFSDGGRYFYALVAFGRSAPRDLRQDVYRILDSLRFDPRVKPDWPASTY